MRWNDNNLDKPKVFDSKDLSEDTQKIMLDKIQERLKEEEDYTEEFKAYEEYKISEKKKRKKILIIVTVIILVLISAVSFFTVRKMSRITNMEYEAQEYIKKEEYDKAAEIYKKLYEETEDAEYIQNYRFVSKNVENKELFKEAENNMKLKDYEGVIEILLTISTNDDKVADKINSQISIASKAWLDEIKGYYDSGNLDKCVSEINKFVNLLPDNISGIDFRNQVVKNDKSDLEKSKKGFIEDKKEIEKLSTKASKKMLEKSKAIVGTQQYITVENANVREKPNRDAKVSGSVHKGEKIYVEDTYVEASNNIWCKVIYSENKTQKTGWISFNIISGN